MKIVKLAEVDPCKPPTSFGNETNEASPRQQIDQVDKQHVEGHSIHQIEDQPQSILESPESCRSVSPIRIEDWPGYDESTFPDMYPHNAQENLVPDEEFNNLIDDFFSNDNVSMTTMTRGDDDGDMFTGDIEQDIEAVLLASSHALGDDAPPAKRVRGATADHEEVAIHRALDYGVSKGMKGSEIEHARSVMTTATVHETGGKETMVKANDIKIQDSATTYTSGLVPCNASSPLTSPSKQLLDDAFGEFRLGSRDEGPVECKSAPSFAS